MIVFARMAPARTVLVAVASFVFGIALPILMIDLVYRYFHGTAVSYRQWLFALFAAVVGTLSAVRFCPAAVWLLCSLATKHGALLAFDGASLIGIRWGRRTNAPLETIRSIGLRTTTTFMRSKYLEVTCTDGRKHAFALVLSVEDEGDIMRSVAETPELRPLLLAGRAAEDSPAQASP